MPLVVWVCITQCVREAGPLEPAVCAAVYAALLRKLDQVGARYAD